MFFVCFFSFRQTSGSSFGKAGDQQSSSSTLKQFMAKLCLHHQQQIVDAFGFLQTEVKAGTSSSEDQMSTPSVAEKPINSECAKKRSDIQCIEETLPEARDMNGGQNVPVSKNDYISPVEQPLSTDGQLIVSMKNGSSIDLGQTDIADNVEVIDDNEECRTTNIHPKSPTLPIIENNLEAKKVSEVGSIYQQPVTGTLEQGPCASDMQPHAHSIDCDIDALTSRSTGHGHTDPKFLPVHSSGAPVKPCLIQRTADAISPNSSRTAKKSSRGSHARPRLGPIGNIVNDPDLKCDIVYVAKPITECKVQSRNHMLPRKNARKSTRGHMLSDHFWEIKTVRSLARNPAEHRSGNYPVPMPEITTSITPKQALAKPDGLPAMTGPVTGDCLETVMSRTLSDQSVVTELPGDVVEITSEELIVEPSQTGQTQQMDQIPSVLEEDECGPFLQQDFNVGIHDISDSSEGSLSSTLANETTDTKAAQETLDTSENMILCGREVDQNVPTEALLNTVSSNIENKASEAEGSEIVSELRNEIDAKCESPEQTKCLRQQGMTCSDNSTMLQMTCESAATIKAVDSVNPNNDYMESRRSDLVGKEMTTIEHLELMESVSESFVTKKGVAKTTLPSDRCLRSAVTKGSVSVMPDQAKLSDVQLDIRKKCTPESNQTLSPNLAHTEDNVPYQDGQYNLDSTDINPEQAQQPSVVTQIDSIANQMCTRQKQKLMVKNVESGKEQKSQELSTPNDECKGQDCVVNSTPENEVNTLPESGKSPRKTNPGKSLGVSERMPLRSRSSLSVSSDSSSPTKNIPHTPERMPLRSRNSINVEQSVDSCTASPVGPVEKLARMPLRNRNSGFAEQTVGKDSCISPNTSSLDSVARMPLRSRNSGAASRHVLEGSTDVIKDMSGTLPEQARNEDGSVSSKKVASSEHMPLRSGSSPMAEQTSSSNSFGLGSDTVSESPNRMSLRRSNIFNDEKQDCLPTPPKCKKLSPRPQKLSRAALLSLVPKQENTNNNATIRSAKLFNNQINVSSIPDSFASFSLPTITPSNPGPCKFLEALNGEANQHLISDLNSRFDKMQKGWVQMDKEGQPAPKPKNKADRLKEIWKSKRRIRKPRSLDQHKLSPVQMLFMKSFDLPNICRWFLQSTETKSLVIIKKVNTRLPSETQLRFTTSSVPESSDGVFPSLQAERLKKHLKKFAIASPVKSNPKNKRLIAKALAHGISKGKEKREPRSATRISSKPQDSRGLIQAQSHESHSKVAAGAKNPTSAKNPASARILRKYSNMREKKQVQQNSLKKLTRSLVEVENSHSMTKKVSKEKLSTRRGRKSAIVKKGKRLAKKAKTPVAKEKTLRSCVRGVKEISENNGLSPKRILPKVLKANRTTSPKTMSKKEMLVKTDKSPQTKNDERKSPLHKSSESLSSPSQIMDMKPLLSEDQVLTRSQRKMEVTLAQTGSPKTSTKRGTETSVTSTKRTRTSK